MHKGKTYKEASILIAYLFLLVSTKKPCLKTLKTKIFRMESYRFLSYLFNNDSIRPFTIHTLSPAYKVGTASEESSGEIFLNFIKLRCSLQHIHFLS